MRVKIREKLDTTQPVNLRALKPADKVKAGFIVQWQSTKFYRKHKLRKDEAAYIEQPKFLVWKGKIIRIFYHSLSKELVRMRIFVELFQKCPYYLIVARSIFRGCYY